jgi:hypothetical protein
LAGSFGVFLGVFTATVPPLPIEQR